MKKCLYLLVAAILCVNLSSRANPGDTTWVYANNVQLTGNGNYDSTVTFPAPGKTYRKIYMIFTLGKYVCGGSGYCGDWDYTVQNYLMTPGGDSLELGRFITPYANAMAPRTPWTWQQHYVFDVTDYASKLQNSATMRIAFSGWTPGFTADIKFAFIEGVPERNVLGVQRLWHGSPGYGGTTSIDSFFTDRSATAPAGTETADLKFTVTGHGSDANGCCEFASHNYQVILNNTQVANKTIWRDNCGSNELYPQSGTWLYQRGNWCPGALVYSNFHDLPGITAGSNFNVALTFDPYSSGGGGIYTSEAALIYYGGINKTLDASLDQIIAPTNDENHFRENPISGNPIVHVRNSGATPINTISFQYGIIDSPVQSYTWIGSLDTLQETDIYLPPGSYQLNNIAGDTGTFSFMAKITAVNGTADADSTNNTMTSQFKAAPLWPSTIVLWFRTNNEFISTDSTICETSWAIYDMWGNIMAKRANAKINTLYRDTVTLPPGYYQFAMYDSSCDGLHWWVYDANPGLGINAGYFYARPLGGANLPLHGDQTVGTYAGDFGCGFTQSFSTSPLVQTSITNVSENNIGISAFPNPAQNLVNVEISGMQQVSGTVQLIDALGRVVSETPFHNSLQQVNTGNLPNGVYTIAFIDALQQNKRLTTRLLIVK